jgi:sec-independent protein translocase protein TatB
MFDFGFSELIVIAVVALIVVGPERLPKVARTAGHLLGRLQRYVSDVKSDIQREMQLEDLKKLQQQVEQQARDLESSIRGQMAKVETAVSDTAAEVKAGLSEPAAIRAPVADAVPASVPANVPSAAGNAGPGSVPARRAGDAIEAAAGARQPEEHDPQLQLHLEPVATPRPPEKA